MTLKECYQDKLDSYCYFGPDSDVPGEFPGYTLDELLEEDPESRDFVIEEKCHLLEEAFCELYKIPKEDLKFFFIELLSIRNEE